MIDPDTILFIPSLRVGNGTGHLKRCLDWAADFSVVHIFTWQREGEELFDYRSHPLVKGNDRVCWHREPGSSWNLIILDNRETRKLPESLEGIPVLAVDETGPLASSAAYLMNTLPLPSKHEINRQGYSFINRPISSEIPAGIRRVLVSFGGEDPEGLADRVYQALQGSELQELIASRELTVNILTPEITSGKTSGRIGEGGIGKSTGLKVYGYIPELSKRLTDYDLVITQYGLTAFEALSSSRYVLLYNPSTYHDRLSVSAGLPLLANTGGKEDLQGALKTALNKDFRHYKDSQEELRKEYGIPVEDFGTWLLSMNPPSNCCPACGSHYRKALARFEEKSYFSCSECGMKYMINFRTREEIYTKEYFFSEYRSQYGKTYIEDFPHIRAMAEERLSVIDSLVSEKGPLLDIGCAYGPFLLSAFERGYAAEGLEISEDAAGYIRENFPDIPVLCGDLADPEIREKIGNRRYRVVTLWYVIEHFSNLQEILPQLYDMIEPGGVLAMATPCGSGVSGIFSAREFYKASPGDHFTIWDRWSAVNVLRRAGFKSVQFRSTGHHPERFPSGIKRILPEKLRLFFSRLAGWGDTFEIYARK